MSEEGFCPLSMTNPNGPQKCKGSDCQIWGELANREDCALWHFVSVIEDIARNIELNNIE